VLTLFSPSLFPSQAVQFVYTFLALLPIPIVFQSFWLHAGYLWLVFLVSIWNGAGFYFEVFTETYSKRLRKSLKRSDAKDLEKEKQQSN
jgi:hypothetical protein